MASLVLGILNDPGRLESREGGSEVRPCLQRGACKQRADKSTEGCRRPREPWTTATGLGMAGRSLQQKALCSPRASVFEIQA